MEILFPDRPVESETSDRAFDVRLIHIRRNQHIDRIADDIDAEKHDHRHEKDDDRGLHQTPDDESGQETRSVRIMIRRESRPDHSSRLGTSIRAVPVGLFLHDAGGERVFIRAGDVFQALLRRPGVDLIVQRDNRGVVDRHFSGLGQEILTLFVVHG